VITPLSKRKAGVSQSAAVFVITANKSVITFVVKLPYRAKKPRLLTVGTGDTPKKSGKTKRSQPQKEPPWPMLIGATAHFRRTYRSTVRK
jgi:hypothetical protein